MTDGATVGDREAAFFLAIKTRDEALLRALVAGDAGLLGLPSPMGVSPVLFAVYYGRADMARVLVELGAPLNVFEAAALGDEAALTRELDADPALVGGVSGDGFSPLGLAAFFGHAGVAEVLLSRGADVNAVSRNAMRVQPLHSAVAGGHAALARALVMAGADVNATQQDEFTPLMAAAQNGDAGLALFLRQRGADAEAVTADGRRAADFAREEGHAALADALGGPLPT
ncbi:MULTISPECIES: ankyrin repeat domain-containing protein [Deinococcus]|uniref:Ankyrin repeat protein n=2 Tax=Deinococcus soli (ex Cha et al. 2016) TaxID=1309411 RepID=A0ACC6KKD9_9DEIO|nr:MULTISPECIES: ankyrin repeat domain-containing protein [Deinococcus]MDK2013181.1 ankyrin repeat domain-containing protein [Deinococcus sp. 43]MDR6220315.1 ankyrin repeat protein [Deinococcus soli (ex Cha et al. 2016)]MDR6330170.1 ankyrin repeat protein [Deinococcus soli (ex Cha et al. 2016)]MDR6752877.1 ankyrin repeat protein [Deinococcus soli (ex Cha et al. 2016)]